mmetsp:Transcript_17725/g.46493  ORF Transcript_17725/g.46493 Transcript_17725/m.46493 type:complete len:231 (+) Transcript_17725:544-1236(+)
MPLLARSLLLLAAETVAAGAALLEEGDEALEGVDRPSSASCSSCRGLGVGAGAQGDMSHRCRWRLEDPPPPVSLPGAVTDAAAAPPPLMLCRARRKGLRAPAPTPASRPLLPRPAPSPPNPLLAPSSSPVALPYPSEPWAGVSATPMTGDACTAARAGGQAVEAAGTSSGSGVYMRMPSKLSLSAPSSSPYPSSCSSTLRPGTPAGAAAAAAPEAIPRTCCSCCCACCRS